MLRCRRSLSSFEVIVVVVDAAPDPGQPPVAHSFALPLMRAVAVAAAAATAAAGATTSRITNYKIIRLEVNQKGFDWVCQMHANVCVCVCVCVCVRALGGFYNKRTSHGRGFASGLPSVFHYFARRLTLAAACICPPPAMCNHTGLFLRVLATGVCVCVNMCVCMCSSVERACPSIVIR